jgi:hypothetical protein
VAASDFIVGNAPSPASFAAPLRDFSALADIPNAYFQGTQQARQRQLQQPIVDPRTGQPTTDINAIIPELMKRGGAEYSKELLPFLQTQELIKAYRQSQGAPDGSTSGQTGAVTQGAPAAAPPSPTQAPATGGPSSLNPAAAGPGNLRVQSQNPAAEGQDTVRSRLTELFGGQEIGPIIPRFAASLGVNPDAPLSPAQVQQLNTMAGKTKLALQAGRGGQMPGMTQGPSNDDTAINQQPGTIAPDDRSINGAPRVPASGVSGSGAPQPGAASPQGAGPLQAAVPQAGAPQLQQPPATLPQNPQIAGWQRAAQGLRQQQQKILQGAQILELAGKNGKAEQDRAAAIGQQAEKYEGLIAKAQEESPEAKKARESGIASGSPLQVEKATEQQKLETASYNKLYMGLQAQGHTSAGMLDSIATAKSMIYSPDFYSGTAEGPVLAWKRALSALGISPGASLPQEAFRKVMASNILHQVDDMKAAATEMGGATGRIFASQIELMEKAAQNPDNSIEANKFLTELSDRSAKRNMQIADMTADYKTQHGGLNAGFEKGLRKWMVEHPMFTAQELHDHRLITAPTMPADIVSPQMPKDQRRTAVAAWARQMGVRPGEPIRLPNGQAASAP